MSIQGGHDRVQQFVCEVRRVLELLLGVAARLLLQRAQLLLGGTVAGRPRLRQTRW